MHKLKYSTQDTHFSPDYACIILHGLGADGSDFKPVVKLLDLPPLFKTRFILPDAETRPVSINGGIHTRAWYNILQLADLDGPIDQEGLDASVGQIHYLINQLIKQGYKSEHISLMGFSQGGALAYWAGLSYPKALRSIIALSAFMPCAQTLWGNIADTHPQKQTPIIIHHGEFDPIVPIRLGHKAQEELQNQGYTTHWQNYPMAHEVCHQQIKNISQCLQDKMTPAQATPETSTDDADHEPKADEQKSEE